MEAVTKDRTLTPPAQPSPHARFTHLGDTYVRISEQKPASGAPAARRATRTARLGDRSGFAARRHVQAAGERAAGGGGGCQQSPRRARGTRLRRLAQA